MSDSPGLLDCQTYTVLLPPFNPYRIRNIITKITELSPSAVIFFNEYYPNESYGGRTGFEGFAHRYSPTSQLI